MYIIMYSCWMQNPFALDINTFFDLLILLQHCLIYSSLP